MIIFFWIIFSLVAGSVGSKRNIGFGGAFLLSIFLSPLIGLILAFNSDKKEAKTYVSPTMLKLIKKGDKLVRAHRYEEAIDLYTSALTYSNQAPNTHFKLAKLFSIEKDINKSLKHLELALEQGFNNFEEINHNINLSYVRNTTKFQQFVDNGYKLKTIKAIETKPFNKIEELQKLIELHEKGVLTKNEFDIEKKKILSIDNFFG